MRKSAFLALILGTPFIVTACGDDNVSGDGETGDTGDTTVGTTGGTVPTTMTTGEPDTDDETTDPTSVDETGGCSEDDACQVDEDCLPGQTCLGNCTCFGDPIEECEWADEGVYGDCLTGGNAACMAPGGQCVVDNPNNATVGVCYFSCEETCDCPAAPEGFEDQVTCDALLAGSEQTICFLDCSGGKACPDDMFCFAAAGLCVHGDTPTGIPAYGDCVNQEGQCEEGVCLVDDQNMPTEGVCAPACQNDDGCPAPSGGDADPFCADFGGGNQFCVLDCTNGETCPDDMICTPAGGVSLCTWGGEDPFGPGYGDCANDGPAVCRPDEECLQASMDGTDWGVCGAGCTTEADCLEAPATGNAPVVCGDLGDGNDVCYLDCSDAQDCPDDMTCTPDGNCAFEGPGFLLYEGFHSGELPVDWTVIDVDGHTPDAGVSFVTDAWVVTDMIVDDFAAVSTSWYAPEDQADDWLITPAITLGPNSMLSWRAVTPDPDFPDGYEVRISTVGPTVDDFLANNAIFSIGAEATQYTYHAVDLAAEGYADEEVWIAFRNNTDNAFLLFVDDIAVTQ